MKTLKKKFLGVVVLFFISCASTTKFPISDVIPAAKISAKMNQDKNKNSVIEVTARYMASADRLDPPKNNYIVWIETENNGIKNIGQLINKNPRKSYLQTSTPFTVKEIFITAEEQGDISYPSGIEISRTTF
jgi:hypothetical protein